MSDSTGSPSAGDAKSGLLDVLVVLADHARLLFFGPIVAALIALVWSFLVAPTFTAATKIIPPQPQQSAASIMTAQLGALAGLSGISGAGPRNPVELYLSLLKSRTIADRIVDRFNLMQATGASERYVARDVLARVTSVTSSKDGLITVEVDDRDPTRAAEIANAYIEELSSLTGRLALTEAQQRRTFFEKQLHEANANLKKAQAELGAAGVSEALVNSIPQAVVQSIAQMQARIAAQEIRLSTMRGYLAETNPDFLRSQNELASMRSQLAQAERNHPPVTAERAEYLGRYRDYKYYETLFELLSRQYEIARLDEAREGAVIQVVDVALPPEHRSRPARRLWMVGSALIVGVLLLIFVVLRAVWRLAMVDEESAPKVSKIAAGLRRLFLR